MMRRDKEQRNKPSTGENGEKVYKRKRLINAESNQLIIVKMEPTMIPTAQPLLRYVELKVYALSDTA